MITLEQKKIIFALAEKISGISKFNPAMEKLLFSNVRRRMDGKKISNFNTYLEIALASEEEFSQLISALTIHTTSWFREMPHYEVISQYFNSELTKIGNKTKKSISVLCAACSTGQEVFSFAMIFQEIRDKYSNFDFVIKGIEIDPVCLETCQKAEYKIDTIHEIPMKYRQYIECNSENTYFSPSKELKDRCDFSIQSILTLEEMQESFDLVVCRNVLIYFERKQVETILSGLVAVLKDSASMLCLGHSELVSVEHLGLKTWKNNIHRVAGAFLKSKSSDNYSLRHHSDKKVGDYRVLVVDDSPVSQKLLSAVMTSKGIKCYSAMSGQEADTFLMENNVDLISLDLHLIDVDGIDWLLKQREKGLMVPVIIISDVTGERQSDIYGDLDISDQTFFAKKDINKKRHEVCELIKLTIDAKPLPRKWPTSNQQSQQSQESQESQQGQESQESQESQQSQQNQESYKKEDQIIFISKNEKTQQTLNSILSHFNILNALDVAEGIELINFNSDIYLCLIESEEPGELVYFLERAKKIAPKMSTIFLGSDSNVQLDELPVNLKPKMSFDMPLDKSRLLSQIEALQMAYQSQKNLKKVDTADLFYPEFILIGGSTGATGIMGDLLKNLPVPTPPIVIVQHIPASFAASFSRRLVMQTGISWSPPRHGEVLRKNRIYINDADSHIGIKDDDGRFLLIQSNDPPMNGHRPSVDFLFNTGADLPGSHHGIAILLTGMGNDGAKGLLNLKVNGNICMAQDAASSVVFGMPKEAIKIGATSYVGNIEEIREIIVKCLRLKKSKSA